MPPVAALNRRAPARFVPSRRAAVVALLVPLFVACSSRDSNRTQARKLLQTINQSAKRLAGASRSFGESVALRLEDKATDNELQAALDKFRETMAAQREESTEWPVPPTPQAESLVATFRSNIDRRVKLIDDYGPRIVEALSKSGAPVAQRARAAREVFDDLAKEADKAVAELRGATQRYAADSGVFAIQ